jgi:hypothetical protein
MNFWHVDKFFRGFLPLPFPFDPSAYCGSISDPMDQN